MLKFPRAGIKHLFLGQKRKKLPEAARQRVSVSGDGSHRQDKPSLISSPGSPVSDEMAVRESTSVGESQIKCMEGIFFLFGVFWKAASCLKPSSCS